MTIEQAINDTYNYLSKHNLVDKVIYNTTLYPFSSTYSMSNDALDCLFDWSKTKEGSNFWKEYCNNIPSNLKNELHITRGEFFDRLVDYHNAQQSKSYEYW